MSLAFFLSTFPMPLKMWEVIENVLIVPLRQEDYSKFLLFVVLGTLTLCSLVLEAAARGRCLPLITTSCVINFIRRSYKYKQA